MVIPSECVVGCAYRDWTSETPSEFYSCDPKAPWRIRKNLVKDLDSFSEVIRPSAEFPPQWERMVAVQPDFPSPRLYRCRQGHEDYEIVGVGPPPYCLQCEFDRRKRQRETELKEAIRELLETACAPVWDGTGDDRRPETRQEWVQWQADLYNQARRVKEILEEGDRSCP